MIVVVARRGKEGDVLQQGLFVDVEEIRLELRVGAIGVGVVTQQDPGVEMGRVEGLEELIANCALVDGIIAAIAEGADANGFGATGSRKGVEVVFATGREGVFYSADGIV